MSNKNKHNSIVFLTTLSVYLGLVLIGAPPVLAQAALTKNFDVKSEIKVKDDLDNKPDNNDELGKDVELIQQLDIAKVLIEFVSDLKKLESIGKIKYENDLIFSSKIWRKEACSNLVIPQESNISNPWLETSVGQLSNALFSLSGISDVILDSEKVPCRDTVIEVKSTSNELSLTYTFNKSTSEKAKIAADKFNEIFVKKEIALRNTKNFAIYKNTKATSSNNQVFIVTRLPRGSLDELLKSAKAKSK